MEFSQTFGTMKLPMNHVTGRVTESPFPSEAVDSLKKRIARHLDESGKPLERHEEDRSEMPIDFRLMDQLLKAAQGADRGVGEFARGVRVGPVARLPFTCIVQAEAQMEVGRPGRPGRLSGRRARTRDGVEVQLSDSLRNRRVSRGGPRGSGTTRAAGETHRGRSKAVVSSSGDRVPWSKQGGEE